MSSRIATAQNSANTAKSTADAANSTANTAKSAVTALKPLFKTKTLQTSYSVGGSSDKNVALTVPAESGMTTVGLVAAASGSPNVAIAAFDGSKVHVRNLATYTIDTKITATVLYIRS